MIQELSLGIKWRSGEQRYRRSDESFIANNYWCKLMESYLLIGYWKSLLTKHLLGKKNFASLNNGKNKTCWLFSQNMKRKFEHTYFLGGMN